MRSKASLQRPSDTVREFGSNVASETPRQRPPPALPRVEQPYLNACKSKTDPPSSHFQNPVRLFQTARHTERPSSHCEKDRRPDTIPTTPRDSLRRPKPASPIDFVHFSSHRKTPSTTASRPHVAGPTAPPHHRPYRPHRRSAPPSVARPSAAPILKKHPRDRPATFLLSPTPPPTLLPHTCPEPLQKYGLTVRSAATLKREPQYAAGVLVYRRMRRNPSPGKPFFRVRCRRFIAIRLQQIQPRRLTETNRPENELPRSLFKPLSHRFRFVHAALQIDKTRKSRHFLSSTRRSRHKVTTKYITAKSVICRHAGKTSTVAAPA